MKKLLFLLIVFSLNAFSEKRNIPLLPSKPIKNFNFSIDESNVSQRKNFIGFEIGALGQKASANADVIGFKFLGGLRAVGVFPLGSRFFLKPFLGIFGRPEKEAKVSVTRLKGEIGINPQYMIGKNGNFTWLVGLIQKLEVNTSNIKIETLSASSDQSDVSDLSGINYRYRLGPTFGFTSTINNNLGLVLDYELSFSVTKPIHIFTGVSFGLIFRL